MYFRLSMRRIVLRLIYLFIISAALGYLIGHTLLVMLLATVFVLTWHYHHLFKLINWLWQSKAISPPQSQGIWGIIYDGLYRQIRQQRAKQKQQNEKIRRFRDGAEALPDAALMLTQELTIEWANKKAQRILGVRWPSDFGQRIDNLLRAPEFADYLSKESFDSPCLVVSPVNGEVQLEIRLMAYGSENVLLLARDISNIHRLEQMRRDFVANVSHELKTPLTVVRGYVEMIQSSEEDFDAHWQKAFSTIEGQVSRMDRLVEQLLNLSKVENNNDDEKQPVNMAYLISTLVDDAKWLNQEKQHKITLNIATDVAVMGIETELKSACSNLLSNAIAYTPPHGEIAVSWEKEGNKAKFSVKDNGDGIKPEHLNRLTERFYRIDRSRSRDTGGSGLGLAIVKHVLHHHQAELVINSHWGQGSEFTIFFDPSTLTATNKTK
ncbi:phosphate regulon sensor histidine kinase PhoR [Colwellia sp. D2M02]|uniref:phosphate regulon sensor histidine kinase PhoR n=1 Tax=Colwellia sp. D2M02 TaxID=2841562 RepID=UPI001C087D94|nr:phosphate regulon sensor histidine kinase PhoR [Colwellia sp. D2M02]MBU2891893.1 phosphate regulon sensor histidine kinase PhoR [Colwellia sp. D2M02]